MQSFKLFLRLVDWRSLRLKNHVCALCGRSVMIRFSENEHAIRCLRCRANPSAMCLASALNQLNLDLNGCHVYELSSRGPFFRFLQSQAGQLTFSEYFEDVLPGDTKDGVPCQDVQHLTFGDRTFDVCTSTDVFEHVPDDAKAFGEVYRVLKPGGYAVFTVPLNMQAETVERARVVDGSVEHLLPPEFHHDRLRGLDQVLCFRNYGADIVGRLQQQGFSDAWIVPPDRSRYWGYGRHVVVGYR